MRIDVTCSPEVCTVSKAARSNPGALLIEFIKDVSRVADIRFKLQFLFLRETFYNSKDKKKDALLVY